MCTLLYLVDENRHITNIGQLIKWLDITIEELEKFYDEESLEILKNLSIEQKENMCLCGLPMKDILNQYSIWSRNNKKDLGEIEVKKD